MPGCRQTGGAQAKYTGLLERETPPIQKFGLRAGAVDLAQ